MTKNRTLLVPSYMQQFACIGSTCEDSCCIGWRVSIDQKTYKKYNKVRDPQMKAQLDKYIKRNRNSPTEENYAKIVLAEDASCSFLNEEKLCTIQLTLGEDLLSNICTTYPRTSNIINELLEKSATISCPEAARLALLNPNGIEFDEIEEDFSVRNRISKVRNTSDKDVAQTAQQFLWEFRIFSIQVLQNRNYTLEERLIILGLFFQKADEYMIAERVQELPDLMASYTTLIEEGAFREHLASIPASAAIQMKMLKELTDERVVAGINSQRYMDCFGELLFGLQYDSDSSVEQIAERYSAAYKNYYAPFMDKHEYILENYLVNYVFKNVFPFGGGFGLFEEYVMLVIHYSMIKLHLIGMAGFHKEEFNTDHVIKLIQSFAKVVEHNMFFLKNVLELLKKNEVTTMAYMTILIKN